MCLGKIESTLMFTSTNIYILSLAKQLMFQESFLSFTLEHSYLHSIGNAGPTIFDRMFGCK